MDVNGPSNTLNVAWASHHSKYGWLVEGIYPSDVSGGYVNSVDISKDEDLICCGDDAGLIRVYRNPARVGHKCLTFRGHGDIVSQVRFNASGSHLLTLGGYDKCLF